MFQGHSSITSHMYEVIKVVEFDVDLDFDHRRFLVPLSLRCVVLSLPTSGEEQYPRQQQYS